MEEHEYNTMAQVEAEHWWYQGLHDCLLKFMPKTSGRLLDVGCGTGQFLKVFGDSKAVGLDFSAKALELARSKVSNQLIQGDIRQLPFENESFDVVVSCDVLDCFDNERERSQALSELSRVLKTKGFLILNLPAFPSLKSSHDEAVHVLHRFRKRELREVLVAQGFEIEQLTYRNFYLFPLATVVRVFRKVMPRKELKSDVELPSSWLNSLFKKVLYRENIFLSKGRMFPFGLSLFAVVKKK